MGIVESVRAVMWARKRQPDQVAYGVALGHERFGPRELLDQAVAAERAGFDLKIFTGEVTAWSSRYPPVQVAAAPSGPASPARVFPAPRYSRPGTTSGLTSPVATAPPARQRRGILHGCRVHAAQTT
jgi:hypothetical protein